MPDPVDHLQAVGEIVRGLRALGLYPVLVGGMALVVLGSRRVTRDFDFVIAHPGDRLAHTIGMLYDRGLELVSRLNEAGEVISTIANRKVAAIRLRLDMPASAYFFNADTGLRVDLLFDFPIPAAKLAQRATRTRIRWARVRHRLREGSPASQENRQSGAFGPGRRRGYCLSRVTSETRQISSGRVLHPREWPW